MKIPGFFRRIVDLIFPSEEKSSLKLFQEQLKTEEKLILNAVQQGEKYTQRDLDHYMNNLIEEQAINARERELNVQRIREGSEKLTQELMVKLTGKFELEQTKIETREQEEIQEQFQEEEERTLLGYEIITNQTRENFMILNVYRKRLLDNLDELQDYIQDMPYATGIEIIYRSNGSIRGYRVWSERIKDQKLKKLS